MRMMKEQEDKFDVDPDWVMPQVTDLVPEGGSLDQQVRKLNNTYFDTSGSGLRLFGITLRSRSVRVMAISVVTNTSPSAISNGSSHKTATVTA